jgi:hypothetical protein
VEKLLDAEAEGSVEDQRADELHERVAAEGHVRTNR